MRVTNYVKVCREGTTTDGREISRHQIDQMAANYDREKYNARIWLEHVRGLMPDGAFNALGDVLSLRAEDDGEGKRLLLAQLDVTSELVEMNERRQKIHLSIEMDNKFSDSGEPYLVGLAVTDSPASLGTEVLRLSQEHRAELAGGDALPKTLFSDGIETSLSIEAASSGTAKLGMLEKLREMFAQKDRIDTARLSDLESAITLLAEQIKDGDVSESLATLRRDFDALCRKNEATAKQVEQLNTALKQPDPAQSQRPKATGQTEELANC